MAGLWQRTNTNNTTTYITIAATNRHYSTKAGRRRGSSFHQGAIEFQSCSRANQSSLEILIHRNGRHGGAFLRLIDALIQRYYLVCR